MDDPLRKRLTQFVTMLPHARELGMELVSAAPGKVTLTMPYSERLIGDPATGVISGGAVSSLMDTCCGTAVIGHPQNTGVTATLDLRIDYMRSARPGDTITAHAECYHVARSVAFVRATAYDADPDRPVATAAGAFTVAETKAPNATS